MHARRIVQCARTSVQRTRTIVRCDAHERAMRRAGSCKATHEEPIARRARAKRVHAIVDESVARDRGASVTTSVTGWCV